MQNEEKMNTDYEPNIEEMNTDYEFDIYVNRCKQFIEAMLNSKQWSGLTRNDVFRWLSNFKGLKDEEEYIVYKLLTNIIYFSDTDIIYLLKDGIKNYLFNDKLLDAQITADFELNDQQILDIINNEIAITCFVPLLNTNKPHESGNYITRLLVQNNIIDATQSVFPDRIEDAIDSFSYKRITIVDDCIGTGNQLVDFLTDKIIANKTMLLIEWAKQKNIEVNYLVLFGYKKTIEDLSRIYKDLKINCLKELDDNLRIFNDNSYIWKNIDERDFALSLFSNITKANRINLFGYEDLDFAFIMDKTIPDWSLPVFWQTNEKWYNLLMRKNSNV
jgi:hypothetical protein